MTNEDKAGLDAPATEDDLGVRVAPSKLSSVTKQEEKEAAAVLHGKALQEVFPPPPFTLSYIRSWTYYNPERYNQSVCFHLSKAARTLELLILLLYLG